MTPDEYKKEYGFDKVSWETLFEPAAPMQWFAANGAISASNPAPLQHWVEMIQTPEMTFNVPKEVRGLFEVAKGCMTYGVLFYPLFAVATDHLFKLCETAIKLRASSAGGHAHLHYKDAVTFLIKKGFIQADNRYRWDAVWSLRNSTAHPKMQMILAPGQAITFLEGTACDINALFEGFSGS